MALLATANLTADSFARKYIFLDNDFLGVLFHDADSLIDLSKISKKGYLIVEPLTEFEFLQSVFHPKQRDLKEKFLEIFYPATDHQTIFTQQRKNALTLSYLYAHNGCVGVGVVDLLLASRALIHTNALIVTGNKKHYPAVLFDTIGILNSEQRDGTIRSFPVLAFSQSKYSAALEKWKKVK